LTDAESTAQASRAEQAAADGTISHKHATVIGKALQDLPAGTTPQQRRFAEKALIRDAQRYSPTDLATRARRITDQYKPERQVDADEDRAAPGRVLRDEARDRAVAAGTGAGIRTVVASSGRIFGADDARREGQAEGDR
jgi:hypothetical protein